MPINKTTTPRTIRIFFELPISALILSFLKKKLKQGLWETQFIGFVVAAGSSKNGRGRQ
jgi:hypothetical protein